MTFHATLMACILAILASACSSASRMSGSVVDQKQDESFLSTEKEPSDSAPSDQKKAEEDPRALEPVLTAGAFLACQYQPDQAQDSELFIMGCRIEAAEAISEPILGAEFRKIDDAGMKISLKILEENLISYTWVLEERANTVFLNTLEVRLKFSGNREATIRSNTSNLPAIERSVAYWTAGQPDNFISELGDEDCIEFINIATQDFIDGLTGEQSLSLGRLNDDTCSNVQRFFCRNTRIDASPAWILSDFQGRFEEYPQACPAGFCFSLPMTNDEFVELSAAMDEIPSRFEVWVAMHDRDVEGRYDIILEYE